ncbi:acetyltransferase (GNAT) family protein [Amycolatopsis sulphurea]|uniref:Acetyltransferase (GNAT) family protein n=1 Tax=Amycolatopsis sulphurea TaxID=76022 RepID=A0A2A9FFR3_9PSEU|nr:GNAT family N-acetyltransferase [Amycolatopsis sulphurea]PFG49773.1 acetyltransferase (GNAT) family protein [Amycolatopsis sulphurea]
MNSAYLDSGRGAVVFTRVADRQWHAVDGDRVVGRAEVCPRPDGRLFLGIDSWHDEVFEQLVEVAKAELPRPLYTVLPEADAESHANWRQAGFSVHRRKREYRIATDPRSTGLDSVVPPDGVRILPAGTARETALRAAYQAIRAEVEATAGWDSMPAEVLARADGTPLVDPLKYCVAALGEEYVGLVRVVPLRQPRIGLVAVRAGQRRRGTGRALLASVFGALYHAGITTASAEADESGEAARTLFEGIGAQWNSSTLELVLPGTPNA